MTGATGDPLRRCLDCGCSLDDRGPQAHRCADCATEQRKVQNRAWHDLARMRKGEANR